MPGDITPEKLAILRRADTDCLEEIRAAARDLGFFRMTISTP